jgi:hypothetical protein
VELGILSERFCQNLWLSSLQSSAANSYSQLWLSGCSLMKSLFSSSVYWVVISSVLNRLRVSLKYGQWWSLLEGSVTKHRSSAPPFLLGRAPRTLPTRRRPNRKRSLTRLHWYSPRRWRRRPIAKVMRASGMEPKCWWQPWWDSSVVEDGRKDLNLKYRSFSYWLWSSTWPRWWWVKRQELLFFYIWMDDILS